MPDLFGAVGGERVAEQDSQAKQLFQLSMAEGQTRLEHEKITLETSKMALQGQQKMLAMLQSQQVPSSAGKALPDILDMYADMAAKSNLPKQASEFASKASTIRKNDIEIQDKVYQAKMKKLDRAAGLLDNVKSEQDLVQAKAFYKMQNPGDNTMDGLQFRDVEKLKSMVMDAQTKASVAATKARLAATQAEQKERDARAELIKVQTRVAEDRDVNLRKAGGVGQIPKAADLQAITDQLVVDYGDPLSQGDYRTLARPIAERMLDLMKDQGLSKSAAAKTAYTEAKHEGVFGGLTERRKEPGSRDRPLPIPVGEDGKPDTAKMKANKFYAGNGVTVLWTGKEAVTPETAEDE